MKKNNIKKLNTKVYFGVCVLFVFLLMGAACSNKSYFTPNTRKLVEAKSVPLSKIQFYVDRDIILERDIKSGEAEAKSGKVIVENGKTVNIIKLKKNTPGVCNNVRSNGLDISFEAGDGKSIVFSEVVNGKPGDPYQISAEKWIKDLGQVTYDGNKYYITEGSEAKLLIMKKVIGNVTTQARTMKGVKVE
jgi:hypothetical protein